MPRSLKETTPPLRAGPLLFPEVSAPNSGHFPAICTLWPPRWPLLTSFEFLGGRMVSPVESVCLMLQATASESPSGPAFPDQLALL